MGNARKRWGQGDARTARRVSDHARPPTPADPEAVPTPVTDGVECVIARTWISGNILPLPTYLDAANYLFWLGVACGLARSDAMRPLLERASRERETAFPTEDVDVLITHIHEHEEHGT